MTDHQQIVDVILRFALSLDLKDWAMCRACFTDEIETDYSDFRGELPTRVQADDYVASRRDALKDLKTQHLSTGHLITIAGSEAVCISQAVIYRLHPDTQEHYHTHCYYTHTLVRISEGWKICKVKQNVFWNEGSPSIHGMHRK